MRNDFTDTVRRDRCDMRWAVRKRSAYRHGSTGLRAWSVLALLVCTLLAARGASARSRGITSASFPSLTTGCNGCHTSAVNTPDVAITADSACLYTGTSTVVHVTISNANLGGAGWNLRLAGGTGTLSTGGPADETSQTQVLSGEVTHTGRKLPAVDDLIHFSAVYNAPSSATTAMLTVWGNAVNGNGNNSGDHAATRDLAITVAAPASCGALPTTDALVISASIAVRCSVSGSSRWAR